MHAGEGRVKWREGVGHRGGGEGGRAGGRGGGRSIHHRIMKIIQILGAYCVLVSHLLYNIGRNISPNSQDGQLAKWDSVTRKFSLSLIDRLFLSNFNFYY